MGPAAPSAGSPRYILKIYLSEIRWDTRQVARIPEEGRNGLRPCLAIPRRSGSGALDEACGVKSRLCPRAASGKRSRRLLRAGRASGRSIDTVCAQVWQIPPRAHQPSARPEGVLREYSRAARRGLDGRVTAGGRERKRPGAKKPRSGWSINMGERRRATQHAEHTGQAHAGGVLREHSRAARRGLDGRVTAGGRERKRPGAKKPRRRLEHQHGCAQACYSVRRAHHPSARRRRAARKPRSGWSIEQDANGCAFSTPIRISRRKLRR